MDRIRVLVLSSVVPNARGSGGELVLHRHLKSNPRIDSEVVFWQRFPFRLKVIGKLRELGFQSLSRSMECLFPVLPSNKIVHDLVHSFRPDVVVTVAHGWWHIQARRIAREFRLPLVSFFQDWWPDFPDVPIMFRVHVEQQFRGTYMDSDVAICVSDQMRQELGAHPNSFVIHPAPSFARSRFYAPDLKSPLRVVYFGNLREYGPLIEDALRAVNGSDKMRLEVFGGSPLWSSGAEDYFRSRGVYNPFIPPDQLIESLRCYKAVLVVMSFDAAMQRRMSTSFPSKLTEAVQLGLPIVIWGPEHCSAVQWARRGDRALCVTNPNPSTLRRRLEELAGSQSEQEGLAARARHAAEGDFNSERIQAQFIAALQQAIRAPHVNA